MKDSPLTLIEQRLPLLGERNVNIQQVITVWLTNQLNTTHK